MLTEVRPFRINASAVTRYYRPVDRHVVHGDLLGFRELCAAAVPASTRFIVLDLDRTLHLARNTGEYLGWELGAYHSYGAEHLDRVEATRDTSRFLVSRKQPIASSLYFLRGCRAWAYPGLFYLLWGRIASRYEASRRLRHRRFGAEPFGAIQAMPILALLHELGGVSVDTAASLAERMLRRFAGDQVFDADDVAWLRARCPGATIVLSSASPRPTVEASARALGIEDWECAEIEIHDGHYSSPYHLSRLFLHDGAPRRITPPSRYRVNAGRAKVRRLLDRYPEMAEPGTEVVGITDTWHGEDHCWADHFSRVIDINSTSPFPPLVVADSPLQAIHSAQVLTRAERERRADGEPAYLDPRRAGRFSRSAGGSFGRAELTARLAAIAGELEILGGRHAELAKRGAGDRASFARDTAVALAEIERAVGDYNDAARAMRPRYLRDVNRAVRRHDQLVRRGASSQRAVSELALEISHRLSAARAALDAAPDGPRVRSARTHVSAPT